MKFKVKQLIAVLEDLEMSYANVNFVTITMAISSPNEAAQSFLLRTFNIDSSDAGSVELTTGMLKPNRRYLIVADTPDFVAGIYDAHVTVTRYDQKQNWYFYEAS